VCAIRCVITGREYIEFRQKVGPSVHRLFPTFVAEPASTILIHRGLVAASHSRGEILSIECKSVSFHPLIC
jgi:hypothetical protein